MKSLLANVLVLVAALALFATACGGDDGSLTIEEARYRLARSDLGAGYLSVTNTTDSAVTLQAASAPGVGRIELHETMAGEDGVMSMRERPEGFAIAAGETLTLEPGGKHLMLFDPTGTDDLELSLDFGDATVVVTAAYDAEASAAMGDMDHSDMDMDMDDDAMEDMDEMSDDSMEDTES